MLATTLNVHRDVFGKIAEVADRHKKSLREIIVLLLMRIMYDHVSLMRGFTTVKYQPDDDRENWHCFHIRLKHDEYEYFIDLRKICKRSISSLIAIAIDRYFDELTSAPIKVVDNYTQFNNYVLRREVVDGIITWLLYWGYPERHLRTLRL